MLSAVWADNDRTNCFWLSKASVGAEKLDKSSVQYLKVLKSENFIKTKTLRKLVSLENGLIECTIYICDPFSLGHK